MPEAMAVLVIVGIVTAMAVPAVSNWIPSYHLKGAANDLFLSFQMAKATAIGKGCNCTITFYQPIGGQSYDYVVFVDTNGNLEYDSGEQVLIKRLWGGGQFPGISFDKSQGQGTGLTFHKNDDGLPAVSFKPSGIPVCNTGGMGMGTAYLVNQRGQRAKVILSAAGNIRIE